MVHSSGQSTCPLSPEAIRELLLRFTRGRRGLDADLTPQELRSYLYPLVKRVVLTGAGPRGLIRWVGRQHGSTADGDHLSVVTELTTRLAETLLPTADPFTGTVIVRSR
jgi:hypothetical protein